MDSFFISIRKMARAKQSKEPIFELGELTLPKNHGKQQANECARRIRSRIPSSGSRAWSNQSCRHSSPIPKHTQKTNKPQEPSSTDSERSPSKNSHQRILNHMQNLVRNHGSLIRQLLCRQTRKIKHRNAIQAQGNFPLYPHDGNLSQLRSGRNGKMNRTPNRLLRHETEKVGVGQGAR